MPCPYSIGIDNEPRAREPGRNLVRPIGERHRDARMVDDLLELPPGRHAQRGEEPRRAPRRDCENHTFRLVRRSAGHGDRKSTRLNSSHEWISYAVFCLKKKNKHKKRTISI